MRPPIAMLLLAALSTCSAWLTPIISHRDSSCLTRRTPTAPSLSLQFEGIRTTLALKSSGDDNVDGDGVAIKKKRVRKVAIPADVATPEGNVEAVEQKAEVPVVVKRKSLETRSKELEDQLKRDIERFKSKTAEDKVEEEAEGLGAVAEQAAGVMSKVLVADFFVVLGFLGYFVAGVLAKSAGNGDVLDGFSALWGPVIQPALGILMAGTLAVGAYNWVGEQGKEAGDR